MHLPDCLIGSPLTTGRKRPPAPQPLSARERRLIRQSFAQLILDLEAAGQLFYARLYEQNPTLQQRLRHDANSQNAQLIQMLDIGAAYLNDKPDALPPLHTIRERHADRGVTAADYAAIEAALIWTLETLLGRQFSPEVAGAWRRLFNNVVGAMLGDG